MGYLFLSIALLAGVTKGYCGKKTSGYTNSLRDATLANIIRMMLCILIGFILIFITGDLKKLIPSRDILLISLLSGASTAVFVVAWLISVKKGAYMMLDIFLMLGVLVPLIASNLFFQESIKAKPELSILLEGAKVSFFIASCDLLPKKRLQSSVNRSSVIGSGVFSLIPSKDGNCDIK